MGKDKGHQVIIMPFCYYICMPVYVANVLLMCHQDPTYDRLSREEATQAEEGLGAVAPTIFEPPTYHQWMATGSP